MVQIHLMGYKAVGQLSRPFKAGIENMLAQAQSKAQEPKNSNTSDVNDIDVNHNNDDDKSNNDENFTNDDEINVDNGDYDDNSTNDNHDSTNNDDDIDNIINDDDKPDVDVIASSETQ